MSEGHGNGPPTGDDSRSTSRRQFLSAVGATGLGGVVGVGTAAGHDRAYTDAEKEDGTPRSVADGRVID